MDRKKIILISSIVLLVIIIAVVLWFIFRKKPVEPTPEPPVDLSITRQIEALPTPSDVGGETANYPLGLKPFATSFAERYGSYSTDAKFKNLEDLMPLMTNNMVASVNNFIKTSNLGETGLFEAYESRAFSTELVNVGDTEAKVVVWMRTTKYMGDKTQSETFNQSLSLKCVKVNNEWKVDDAVWQ